MGGNANSRFRKLLEAFFEKTGCPILLNTSFNVRGKPIVCSPADALICMMEADLDALVIGDFIIDRADIDDSRKTWLYTLTRNNETKAQKPNLYTFV